MAIGHKARIERLDGRLAQLVERFVYTEDVGSSSLSPPTILLGAYGASQDWQTPLREAGCPPKL